MPPGDFPFIEEYVGGLSVKEIFDRLSSRPTWKVWCTNDFADLYDQSHAEAFRNTLIRYAETANKQIPSAKSPYSEFFFEICRDWLQDFDIRFVHVVRNPFDVIASLKHSPYHHKGVLNHVDTISVHSRNWLRSASMGLARTLQNRSRYHVVKYETLVNDPISTCRALCAFLDEDLEEERMLNRVDYSYHDTNTTFPEELEKTAQKKDYVYIPNSRKHYLSDSEVKCIASTCGEVARALGYEDEDFQSLAVEHPKIAKLRVRVQRGVRRILARSRKSILGATSQVS
jgi:hypothetical protein